ncbi:MAG: hypothetical protein ACTHMM_04990 [Agriterribacter sp.]
MKKIIIQAFLMMLVTTAVAQTGSDTLALTPAESAVKQSLQLNNVQAGAFFLLERARDSSFKKMIIENTGAGIDLPAKIHGLNDEHYTKVAAILTNSQYTLYRKLEEAKRKKMITAFEKRETNNSQHP